ncbi:MAG: hypothetical protein DHS20C14_19570 [Phycisphaeraceae bacterium]|nr:MAG: hypothetical protein DHS20C14_19570 [Phycisphaeraceae bacterium]
MNRAIQAMTAAAVISAAGSALLAADQEQRWEGSWHNETFGSTGSAVADIEITGSDVSFSLDLGGFVFGVGDPPPIVATGVLNGDGTMTLNEVVGNAVYGTVIGEADDTGNFSLCLSDASGGFFDLIEIRGTWTSTEFRTRYDIFQTVGGSVFATGTFNMDFVPPPCFCDVSGNGVLNVDDIEQFVSGFLAGDLGAGDCDGTGVLNVDDIECFVSCFLDGCG